MQVYNVLMETRLRDSLYKTFIDRYRAINSVHEFSISKRAEFLGRLELIGQENGIEIHLLEFTDTNELVVKGGQSDQFVEVRESQLELAATVAHGELLTTMLERVLMDQDQLVENRGCKVSRLYGQKITGLNVECLFSFYTIRKSNYVGELSASR